MSLKGEDKMKIQKLIYLGMPLVLMGVGCSESSSFKGRTIRANVPKAIDANRAESPDGNSSATNETPDADPVAESSSEPVIAPNPEPEVETPVASTLDLVLPSKEIRSGGKTMQTKVVIRGPVNAKVVWSVKGPEGIDVGKIDSEGLYTSPLNLEKETKVVITAALADDPKIADSDELQLIPTEQIFVGCSKGTSIFPIIADVYRLPRDTIHLPDFASIPSDKITTVCMDQYDVPVRNFTEGFPGVPKLFEWFALHTAAKIIVPKSGTYTFRLNSDDGSILSIDGAALINNDGQHSPNALDAALELTKGPHQIVLDYFQGPADEIALELFWKVPGTQDFIIVPPSAFQ